MSRPQCAYGCPKSEFRAEASLGKNFPKVIPSLLHVFSGWCLQGLVIWCVSLSKPQNIWCKHRHIARRGGDISLGDARISNSGCPNLPRLNIPGCPKLNCHRSALVSIKSCSQTSSKTLPCPLVPPGLNGLRQLLEWESYCRESFFTYFETYYLYQTHWPLVMHVSVK